MIDLGYIGLVVVAVLVVLTLVWGGRRTAGPQQQPKRSKRDSL